VKFVKCNHEYLIQGNYTDIIIVSLITIVNSSCKKDVYFSVGKFCQDQTKIYKYKNNIYTNVIWSVKRKRKK